MGRGVSGSSGPLVASPVGPGHVSASGHVMARHKVAPPVLEVPMTKAHALGWSAAHAQVMQYVS